VIKFDTIFGTKWLMCFHDYSSLSKNNFRGLIKTELLILKSSRSLSHRKSGHVTIVSFKGVFELSDNTDRAEIFLEHLVESIFWNQFKTIKVKQIKRRDCIGIGEKTRTLRSSAPAENQMALAEFTPVKSPVFGMELVPFSFSHRALRSKLIAEKNEFETGFRSGVPRTARIILRRPYSSKHE